MLKKIEEYLVTTFEDHKLSKPEQSALEKVFEEFKNDEETLRFIRNTAFKIATSSVRYKKSKLALDWVHNILKIVDKKRGSHKTYEASAYFSPGQDCLYKTLQLLKNTQKKVDICVFTITHNDLRDAILELHDRKVKVRIITDDEKMEDAGSDIYTLKKAGIPIKTDDGPQHMHHKFAIFDQKRLLSGSYNWTRSASKENYENIIVTDQESLIATYQKEFNTLWKKLTPL